MTLVGCDLHSRNQQVAVLATETGEMQELRLAHDGDAVEQFYASLPRPVTVGIESTGYALWFHALLQRQGHTLLVGDAARIRAMVVRNVPPPFILVESGLGVPRRCDGLIAGDDRAARANGGTRREGDRLLDLTRGG